MKAILDYVYSGAAQVDENALASFLAVAEDLKIDGLMNKYTETETDSHLKQENPNEASVHGKKKTVAEEKSSNILKEEPGKTTLPNKIKTASSETNDALNTFETEEILSEIEKDESSYPTINNKEKTELVTKKKNYTSKQNVTAPRKAMLLTSETSKRKFDVYCQVCKIGVPNKFYLQAHMHQKSETQCNDCKLFFSSCHTLSIHKRGRCKRVVSK